MNKPTLDFSFVILHYVAFDMTVECVDNLIKRFGNNNILIVIVDNASPNGSGKKLKERFHDNSKVVVILHNRNDGFARGNNIGFNYIKQHYDVKYMVVMNNDVLIDQDDFLGKTKEIYNKYKFAVLGPSIFAPKYNLYQNPGPLKCASIKQTVKFIKTYRGYIIKDNFNYYILKILHYTVFWWIKPIYKIFKKEQNAKKNKTNTETPKHNSTKITHYVTDSVLCGACYIFSKDFVQNRDYCFDPHTYLYFEEQILAYQCQNNKLPMLYTPDIEVKHLIGISTELSEKDNRRRYLSMWKENIKSAKYYLKILKTQNEYN